MLTYFTIIRYSPEQLYAVVAAVDLYEDFLPWCQRSEILRRHPDGSFDAELEIGFKFLIESYVSHVELTKPKYIKVTLTHESIFIIIFKFIVVKHFFQSSSMFFLLKCFSYCFSYNNYSMYHHELLSPGS